MPPATTPSSHGPKRKHRWLLPRSDRRKLARPEELDDIHGPAPHDPNFGGNVLTVDTSGHSDYWKPGSAILNSQAAVILGRYNSAELEHGEAP